MPEYDAFVLHASEDKPFVEELVAALEDRGRKIWFDKNEIFVGDSIRRSIDRGLTHAKYGIPVLSPAFFSKSWTNWELDGFVERQIAEGGGVILPVWHRLTHADLLKISPSLTNMVALTSDLPMDSLAEKLNQALTRVRT